MLNKDDMKEQESENIRLKLKTEKVNTNSRNPSQIPPVISTPIVNNQTAQNLNPNPVVINAVPLINNDIQGFVPIMKPKQFGSKPISTYCPNCRFPVTTVSTKKCNCCSCCWCFCCIELWLLIQCCRNKEITCYDYKHTCPRCGFEIGNYDAW